MRIVHRSCAHRRCFLSPAFKHRSLLLLRDRERERERRWKDVATSTRVFLTFCVPPPSLPPPPRRGGQIRRIDFLPQQGDKTPRSETCRSIAYDIFRPPAVRRSPSAAPSSREYWSESPVFMELSAWITPGTSGIGDRRQFFSRPRRMDSKIAMKVQVKKRTMENGLRGRKCWLEASVEGRGMDQREKIKRRKKFRG